MSDRKFFTIYLSILAVVFLGGIGGGMVLVSNLTRADSAGVTRQAPKISDVKIIADSGTNLDQMALRQYVLECFHQKASARVELAEAATITAGRQVIKHCLLQARLNTTVSPILIEQSYQRVDGMDKQAIGQ